MGKRKTQAERQKQYGGTGFKLNQLSDFKKIKKRRESSKKLHR